MGLGSPRGGRRSTWVRLCELRLNPGDERKYFAARLAPSASAAKQASECDGEGEGRAHVLGVRGDVVEVVGSMPHLW